MPKLSKSLSQKRTSIWVTKQQVSQMDRLALSMQAREKLNRKPSRMDVLDRLITAYNALNGDF